MTNPTVDPTRLPLLWARPSRILSPLVAVVLLLAACGPAPSNSPSGGNPTSSNPASASPASSGPSGTLTVGLSADAESMDPYRVYQNAGFSIMYAIFDTLVTIGPDGTLGPGLADSWSSPDSTTLELKLHPG